MRNAIQRLGRIFVATLATAMVWPVAASGVGGDPGEFALAERLADTARLTVATRNLTKPHLQMAGALLEAAVRLNPNEPRYSRLWADAMLQAGDSAGAIKALNAYLTAEPDDRQAMIQLTDLHAASYEMLDKRLEYLRDWVDDARLPEEVRSHIAFLAHVVYVERKQFPEAKSMLDLALKLNPLNMDALRVRFEGEVVDGTPYERMATLLAILKSNPAEAQVLTRVAQELAAVGLAQQSLQFYGMAFNMAARQGMSVGRENATAYATELLVLNQGAAAKQIVDQLIAASPGDYGPLALRLMIERAAPDQKEASVKTIQLLRNSLLNRLQGVRQALGDKGATTRPVDSQAAVDWGSFDSDIKNIKEMKGDEAVKARKAYADMLVEIAWMEIYFRETPADAKPMIEALKQLVPENDAALARLEGWSFLLRGEKPQATVKLSAIKDKDPMAELGLIRMMDTDASKAAGDKLLAKYPVGLTAVLIVDALRDRKVALTPDPALSGPIAELLAKFPSAWMAIIDQPQNFYALRAEPLMLAHAYGEPMLVRVTVSNLSEYPITIGNDGILHPDLWFDADFRGRVSQNIPSAAYDRLGHVVVLKPHASVSQVVRIDQGAVAQMLAASPFEAMQIVLHVRTNPSTASQSGIGPAGQKVQAGRFMERNAFPLNETSLQRLTTALQQAGPAEKIAKTDLCASTALTLIQHSDENGKRSAMQLVELLKSTAHDSSPAVATWAAATIARLSGPTERPMMVAHLLNDPYWPARMFGLSSMGTMKIEDQMVNASRVAAHDTDPVVVEYAKALGGLLDLAAAQAAAAATQPSTTHPTTNPSPLTQQGPIVPLPTAPPTTKPTGPGVVIPQLDFTLPSATQPAPKP